MAPADKVGVLLEVKDGVRVTVKVEVEGWVAVWEGVCVIVGVDNSIGIQLASTQQMTTAMNNKVL